MTHPQHSRSRVRFNVSNYINVYIHRTQYSWENDFKVARKWSELKDESQEQNQISVFILFWLWTKLNDRNFLTNNQLFEQIRKDVDYQFGFPFYDNIHDFSFFHAKILRLILIMQCISLPINHFVYFIF